MLFSFYKESNEDEIFKLTEELEELKITNESLQKVRHFSILAIQDIFNKCSPKVPHKRVLDYLGFEVSLSVSNTPKLSRFVWGTLRFYLIRKFCNNCFQPGEDLLIL